MNKKAVVKIGFGAFFIILILTTLVLILSSKNSMANSFENTYTLGEKVKIGFSDFKDNQSLKVKINSPTKEYITKITGNSIVYKPEELGEHIVKIYTEEEIREIKFNVINNINETESKFDEPIESIEQIIRENGNVENETVYHSEDIIVINRAVRWNEKVESSSKIRISKLAENISLYELSNNEKIKVNINIEEESIFSNILSFFSSEDYNHIKTHQTNNELEIEYITPAPVAEEKILSDNKKTLKITSPEGLDYANVLAYMNVTEKVKNSDKDKIKIYWNEEGKYLDFKAYDLNNNEYIDYIEWIIPHLSEQNFEIILITNAEHLNSNKDFIEDIYAEVREIDNLWSPTIYSEEYVKVIFERNLTNENDITILPKIISGNPIIEVYDSVNNKLTEFRDINNMQYNKVYLTNLVYSTDSFYLKILGGDIQFDHIIDPSAAPGASTDLRAQTCAAEDTTNTKGSFADACDGTYPAACGAGGDLLSCNDAQSETHAAQSDKYAGVRISTFNSTITNCESITSVRICYEWWSSSASVSDCDISVDANGGSSYTAVTTTCPSTSANPGLTCTDVTSLESWSCSNFFGSTGTRAFAKSELDKSTTGVAITITWDSLFFNVSYEATSVVDPRVVLNLPTANQIKGSFVNFSYNATSANSFQNCSLWDDSSGIFRLNKTNSSNIQNGTFNYITNNYANGTYNWNIQCCAAGSCQFATSNRTFIVDTFSPVVNLIYPSNNSNISDSFNLYFVYNVSDATSSISNCSILVDNQIKQTLSNLSEDINQTFYQYVDNGIHNWSVSCTDQVGNIGYSENRSINVSIYQPAFSTGRFYETYPSSFGAQNAKIWLNETRDNVQNTNSFSIQPGELINLVNASTWFMSNNGALIPSGTTVTFSASFSASHVSVEATWKLYIANETGTTLLCQNGDDAAQGTPTSGSISSQNTTCINRDIRLSKSDRILMVMNINNTGAQARTITHDWDAATSSYLDLNITSEGFIRTNLTSPQTDPNVALNDIFNATCTTSCSIGICRNVYVYIQQNTSSTNWININSTSGNIILNTGQSNPIYLGNITGNNVNTNFTLKGNIQSVNNIRCVATGSYDSLNGSNYTQITITNAGATAPTVNLTSPNNGTWLNNSIVTLYYNASDINNNIVNSSLILNGIINQTNQSTILNGQINNFTLSLEDGIYNWTVNVTDSTSLNGTDIINRWFYVDTRAPQINLSTPQSGGIFQRSSIEFNFSATDNLDSSLTCNLTIDSIVRRSNFEAQNGSLINSTITGLTIGLHYWNVTCVDNAGNRNISQTWNFTIEDLPPSLELITQDNSFFNTSVVTLFYNATDNDGFINSTLVLNGFLNISNQSTILSGQINNFTLTLQDGFYNWTVNVTDTGFYNTTNSTRGFVVDTIQPQINLSSPVNMTNLNTSTVNFSFITLDNLDKSLTCNITLDSLTVGTPNFAATNGSLISTLIGNVRDGIHYWNVTCVDDAGNKNVSETRMVNITENPRLTLITQNNSYFNVSNINLTYLPSDNTNLSLCELYVDGSFNQTNQSTILNGIHNNFTLFNINEGLHSWYVKCFDYMNLTNTSEIRYFTVDLGGLNVTLISPQDGLEIFSSNVTLVYNVTDNIDTSLSCNISANTQVVDSFTATSGINTVRNVLFPTGGLKIWNVTCVDSSNNRVTSQTWNFTLAFAPFVNITSPANGSWLNYSIIPLFYNTTDDNDNIANSTLMINGLVNITNQSTILNSQINNFTINLPDGTYNWTVNVTDTTNLHGWPNKTNIFYVDTRAPQITVNSPVNNQVYNWNNLTFDFVIADNMDSQPNCTISIDDTPETGLQNFLVANEATTLKYTLRQDGNYTFSIQCRDKAYNINVSQTINFSVEAPPNVTLISPANEATLNSSSVTFTYYPEDAITNGIYNCSILLDGKYNATDAAPVNKQNNIFSVLGIFEGFHNWTVECTDVFPDFNVYRATQKNFTIDTQKPQVNLLYPENNTNILRSYLFNFTAIDNLDTNLTCNLYIDNNLNRTNLAVENDSIESVQINNLNLGTHTWNVTCFDNANNSNFSEKRTFNVTLPDLTTNTTSIYFNNSAPRENETISIIATIYNLYNVSISNVSVQFYLGNPSFGGTQISTTQFISIQGLSQTNVSVDWDAAIGTNTIFVLIDPPLVSNGSIWEWNETNNYGNKSIEINGWHYVYGDINSESEFQLADADSNSVIKWENTNFSSGNIYVSDYESLIYWPSIKAIGKNTSEGNTTNDFADIDYLLNMSSFSDSIYTTYTASGQIRNVTNYKIFNRLISQTPVADSINNSNFVTGILWDSSDSLNSEFDITDKEDLLFVTKINQNQQGAYGIYDYEIRIPAKLRNYKTNQNTGVLFYTEIY